MWELYDAILSGLPQDDRIKELHAGEIWTLVKTEKQGAGIAMTTAGATRDAWISGKPEGLSVRRVAETVKSWNLLEASGGMAAVNACYNTPERLEMLNCEEPYEHYCTHGLDLAGKTVGVIGHLKMPEETLQEARQVYILERNPRPGDYPDSACEYLLPECDAVLITGSTLINKTLPRLLKLCRDAYTILTGPTVPLCPALLEWGIDRLAGMVIMDADELGRHVAENRSGSIYPYGKTFLLTKEKV